jgi:hypothetical protein
MLGLVAYELAAGEIPPALRSFEELKNKGSLAFQKLPRVSAKRHEFPKRIEQIISRMTSRSPHDRYEKLEDALNELRRVVPSLSMAKDSFYRCIDTPGSDTKFFKTFYDEFQRLCPQAKQKFQHLEHQGWERQHQMLKQSILMLFVYCERPEWEEPNILTRTAEMHNRKHHNISADFYEPFVEALVHTVCGYPPHIPEPFDPHCVNDESKEAIARAWRNAAAPGINYMQRKY